MVRIGDGTLVSIVGVVVVVVVAVIGSPLPLEDCDLIVEGWTGAVECVVAIAWGTLWLAPCSLVCDAICCDCSWRLDACSCCLN